MSSLRARGLRNSAAAAAILALAAAPAVAQPSLVALPGAPTAAPAFAPPPVVGAPAEAAAAAGAPFASMVRGQQGQQQRQGSGPQLPLSTEPMAIDQTQMNGALARAGQQVDDRLENLRIGSGQLTPPDTSGYRGELDEMASIQRQLRLLELKQKQANAAIQLWSTVYDPRREENAARAAVEARQAAEAPAAAPAQQQGQAQQQARPQAEEAQPLPFPRVLSVRGTGSSLRATLLVPYTGELDASVGTVLPGERRVTRITADGVAVSDPKLGAVALGYGDSVPLMPPVPARAAQPTMMNPSFSPPPMVFSQPPPPPPPPVGAPSPVR